MDLGSPPPGHGRRPAATPPDEELSLMRPRALMGLAIKEGVEEETVEGALDTDDVKGKLIEIILGHREAEARAAVAGGLRVWGKRQPAAAKKGSGAKQPGPLQIEQFDRMCDLTIRPQRLADMMMDKIDAAIGSNDLAAVSAVVEQARTRFGGHTDVQIELTSLRVYEARLRASGGGSSEPVLPAMRAAVIGAGYMGSRIAVELLLGGHEVSVFDVSGSDYVRQAMGDALEEALGCGYISATDVAAALLQLNAVDSIASAVGREGCRLVCECVADNLSVKEQVFRDVVANCNSEAIFGSATMNLSLDELQALLPTPWQKRLIGLRFLAPIIGVSLVEVAYSYPDNHGLEGPPSRAEVKEVLDIMVGLGKTAVAKKVREPAAQLPRIGAGFGDRTSLREAAAKAGASNSAAAGASGLAMAEVGGGLLASFPLRPNAMRMVLAQLIAPNKTSASDAVLSLLMETPAASTSGTPPWGGNGSPRLWENEEQGGEAAPAPATFGCPDHDGITKEDIALPNRADIAKGAFAFILHGVFTPTECDGFIAASEQRGYDAALINDYRTGQQVLDKGYRNSHRNIWDSAETAAQIFTRIRPYLPAGKQAFGYGGEAEEWVCVGLNERLRTLRYDAGEYFLPHYDGMYVRADGLAQSYLTVMLYLNSCDAAGEKAAFTGGETRFVQEQAATAVAGGSGSSCGGGGEDGQALPQMAMKADSSRVGPVVLPRTGSALIFTHPVLHEGCEVTHGRKYVLRTDVMYSDE